MPAFLLSAIGNVPQMAGAMGNVLQTGARLVMAALGFLTRGLLSLATLIVGSVVGVVTGFAAALIQATRAAVEYAAKVNDLRLGSGMSLGQAGALSMRFGAFGITPEMLAQARGGQHESIYRLRGQMFGVDVTDPASIARRAQSYGNDLQGFAMRRAMLQGIGMDTERGRWLASLSPGQVREQQGFQQKLGQSLGVSPETMSRLAEALPLAQAKLATFLQMVQLKFVEGALPMMEKGIEWLSDFVSRQGPLIAQTIHRVFEWIFVEAPELAINGARAVVGAFQWLSDGFFTVAGTVVAFLRTLESADSGLGLWAGRFLGVIDFVVNGFNTISMVFHNFIATIANVVILSIRNLFSLIDLMPEWAKERAGFGDGFANRLANTEFEPWRFNDPAEASNLAGRFADYQQGGAIGGYADRAQAALDGWQGTANGAFDTVNNAINTVANALGDKDARRSEYRAMIAELQGIRKSSEEIAGNTRQGGSGGDFGAVRDWLARFAVERARDRYLQETR